MPTLLERSTERATIQAALKGALQGSGQCVAITGAAGLGKSRLVELACAGAADRGMQVARARGDEFEACLIPRSCHGARARPGPRS
jgi:predicted ATPase